MKFTRGLCSVMIGLAAVLGVIALLRPGALAHARPTAVGDHVILSEVFYDATGSDDGLEWVELYNPTASAIDLSRYSLGNGPRSTSSDYRYSTVQLTGVLLPDHCWVVGGPTSNITNALPIFNQAVRFSPNFQNGGASADGIALFNVPAASITTRTVPIDAVIYGTTNDRNLIDETGAVNRPDVGASTPGRSNERVDITGTWRIQSAPNPNNCTVLTTTVKPPLPTLPGRVLISAVHFSGYAVQDNDEGFRLTNVSTQAISLTNWVVVNGASAINLTGTLQPNQSIWVAKTAISFAQQFGFRPDYKYVADADASVPLLAVKGSVPALADNDKLVIRDGASNEIDAVIWGNTTVTDTGWIGSNVQRYAGTLPTSGQIVYRKLEEASGRIAADTNTALDWANDRTDPAAGRRVQYPGWDLEKFWQTAKVTGTAALTVAIAPDNAYHVIAGYLSSAQRSIKLEVFSFENFGLAAVITQAIHARGISVTILLEGGPPGGITDDERWICQQIEAVGGQCWFMITNTSAGNTIHARYEYLHVKMMIVDDRVVAIGSENLSPRSMPYGDLSAGLAGQRGTYLITDAPEVAARARAIWQADFDPNHHLDLYRWSATDPRYGPPPPYFTPVYTTGGAGYRVRYPVPLQVTGPLTFELLTAPESALRASDALLGLISRLGAGDTIDVEQLDEPPHWGGSSSNPSADPNIRLQALIGAASRGAHVRLLLDRYFDAPALPTSNEATRLYVEALRANSPALQRNLEVRLGDPAMYGIHNKMFLFNLGGRKIVHAGSLNGTEVSNKANREVALQVESGAAYDYLHAMFEYDWAFQPRLYLPLLARDYVAPPQYLLISKVFYLGSTSTVTGSEWVQVYNPTVITVSLHGYKIGDQAQPGPTGYTVDGMWLFPANASIAPGQLINIATTGQGFYNKYGFPPQYAFFSSFPGVVNLTPYIGYTPNISFSLANNGDEVLLLGPADQLVDGVAWGTGSLPGNVSCVAIDPNQYPLGNPAIKREPLWRDTDNCPNDFVIDLLAEP